MRGQLRITLADRHYPLELALRYRTYPDTDVIERWTSPHHTGKAEPPIIVEHCNSAHWILPVRQGHRLSQVAGEWSAEFQLARTPLPYGETTLTSCRGITRHQTNPWLMIDPGDATEEHGEVWSAVLAWSGGWRLVAHRNSRRPGNRQRRCQTRGYEVAAAAGAAVAQPGVRRTVYTGRVRRHQPGVARVHPSPHPAAAG